MRIRTLFHALKAEPTTPQQSSALPRAPQEEPRGGASSHPGERRFFFIRGHPRSGTNWVSNLLNLHPQVCCTGEFHLETIYNAVCRTRAITWQITGRGRVGLELDEAFRDMIRRCISVACTAERPNAMWFGDRTPSDLLYWLPGARYIWVLRDGRDVAVSWTFHQLRKGRQVIEQAIPREAGAHLLGLTDQFARDPTMFDRQPELLLQDEAWVKYVAFTWDRRFRSDLGAAEHIDRPEVDGQVLRVRYERLHSDTEAERARLYGFLQLNPSDAAPITRGSFTTAGFGSHNPMSFRRKGEVGDWKNYFTDRAARAFDEIAGDSLRRAGYEPFSVCQAQI